MKIKSLKMLTDLTFLFVIINSILGMKHSPLIEGVIYIYIAAVYYFLSIDLNITTSNKSVISISSIIPLIFIINNMDVLIASIIIICIMMVIQKNAEAGTYYNEELYKFKRMFIALVVIGIIDFFAIESSSFNYYIVPYMIIYIIFHMFLIRILRNYKFKIVNKGINKINNTYLFVLIISVLIISTKGIREFLINSISSIYNLLTKGIIYLIGLIAKPVSNMLGKIDINVSQEKIDSVLDKVGSLASNDYNNNVIYDEASTVFFDKYLPIIFACIAVILLVIFIKKVLLQKMKREEFTADYCEEKEFIFNDNKKSKKSIADYFKPQSVREKIFNTYKSFMEKCIDHNVDIKKSDTSLDINIKSSRVFSKSAIYNLREIYLKAKYSDKECTDKDLEKIKSNLNAIKKK